MTNEIIPVIIVGSFFVITGLFYAGSRVKKAEREKIRNKEDDIIFVQKHKEKRRKEEQEKIEKSKQDYQNLLINAGLFVPDEKIPKGDSSSNEAGGIVTRKNKKYTKYSRKKPKN
jgi:adenine-specific DNA methylase